MNVLWIFAHPEQRSMNAALKAEGLGELARLGHRAEVGDLYAMGFNPVLDAADVRPEPGGGAARLIVGAEQQRAYDRGELSEDIRAEQRKAEWADVLVFQFPLWWQGPPAILKGWFDRVLARGFGFGLRDPEGRSRRYGDGALAGKRALVITTVGARAAAFGPRGIHGHIDQVLFPLLHGTFWYTGAEALPPFVVYGADQLSAAEFAGYAEELRRRMRTLADVPPLRYRHERGGEYDGDLVLLPQFERGRTGLGVHEGEPGGRGEPDGRARRTR